MRTQVGRESKRRRSRPAQAHRALMAWKRKTAAASCHVRGAGAAEKSGAKEKLGDGLRRRLGRLRRRRKPSCQPHAAC